MSNLTAPSTRGAPPGAPTTANRAEHPRRTDGAPEPGAPAAGAPPLPLYKERRTGARLPVESAPKGVYPARETWPPGSIGEEANCAAPVHDLAETIAELGGKCPVCERFTCECEDVS